MKKEAYEVTTIKRVAKEVKDIIRNCGSRKTEAVKFFVANKKSNNTMPRKRKNA